jgi:hypothetical protein
MEPVSLMAEAQPLVLLSNIAENLVYQSRSHKESRRFSQRFDLGFERQHVMALAGSGFPRRLAPRDGPGRRQPGHPFRRSARCPRKSRSPTQWPPASPRSSSFASAAASRFPTQRQPSQPSCCACSIEALASRFGMRSSSLLTASGIQSWSNGIRSSRSIRARFEISEVSFTATIRKVFGQFLLPVVTRNAPLGEQVSKQIARHPGGGREGICAPTANRGSSSAKQPNTWTSPCLRGRP